jgi:general secretion pathway protein I
LLLRVLTREQRRLCAGFTIIEVLVALAVVAATLAAIGAVIATTARATHLLEQRVSLIQTARAIETGLPRRGQLPSGQLAGEIGGHRWRIDVSPLTTGDLIKNSPWIPQAVAIRVQSPSGTMIELNTVRLTRRAKE